MAKEKQNEAIMILVLYWHIVLRVEINRETKEITHILDDVAGSKMDDSVKGGIKWERRYRLM